VMDVDAIDASDPIQPVLLHAVTVRLVAERRRIVADALMDDKGQLSEATAAAIPITIDTLYKSARDGADPIFYFQASQWTKPQDMEAPHVQLWGWLRKDARGEWQTTGTDGHAGSGSEEGMMSSIRQEPLGIIDAGTRTFWIFHAFGLESSAYEIYEIT